MWKPSSVVEVVENSHYVEELLDIKRGHKICHSTIVGFVGKAPWTFSRGGNSRPPPYGNRVAPRVVATSVSMETSATSQASSRDS
jgi:hypothetical protein